MTSIHRYSLYLLYFTSPTVTGSHTV